LLVLGVVAAVGAAAWLAPVPEDVGIQAVPLPVPAGPTTLVCPGPVVLPESDDEVDPEFNPAPVGSVDRLRLVAGVGEPVDAQGGGDAGADDGSGPTSGALLEAWPLADLAGAPVLVADATGITGGAGGAGGTGSTVAVASGEPSTGTVGRAQPVGQAPARVAGAVVSTVTAGDLRGTSAASCQRPGSEFWLVGGGTELGTTTLLVVHNPGATPAEIGLAMWGPAGRVELGGGARYIVPSGGELSLRLSALAAELARTVVHVTSAGGQIAAFLQVSELDGFSPGGADLVVPGAAPAQRQVLTTFVVPESELDGPGAGLLRLLAPDADDVGAFADDDGAPEASDDDGAADDDTPDVAADSNPDEGADSADADSPDADSDSDADADADVPDDGALESGASEVPVRVTFYGESGPVALPGTEALGLVPGEVTDVDLGGLPAGSYTAVVESDFPILAAARIERLGAPAAAGDPAPVEQAWIAASLHDSTGLFAVPAGLSASAIVTGIPSADQPADEPVGLAAGLLRAFDESGAELIAEEISLPAGTTLDVPLPEGTAAVELVTPTVANEALAAGSALAWGVLAESQGTDGPFVSVLTSPVHGAAVGEVTVRGAQRLPLE